MANRNLVVPLIEAYLDPAGTLVPRGTIAMDHIVKDWQGGGTTCGYLPHWLWWRLGYNDTKLMCRYEPDTPFVYNNGLQINRVYAHEKFNHVGAGTKTKNDGPFLERVIYPKTGDAVIIQGAPFANGVQSTHIFVVLDSGTWDPTTKGKGTWRVAETGQTGNGGHITTHNVHYQNGKWMVGNRWMLGWLDIDAVSFGTPRPGTDYLAPYGAFGTPATATDIVGIWLVSSGDESWYYFFYKGFRVFYADAGSPTMFRGGGYWVPSGGQFAIMWDWGNRETLSLTSKTTATGSWGNGALDAKKVTAVGTMAKMGRYSSCIGHNV